MALILVLMALTIITALVVEFAYGVYVNTSLLYNWQASQRLTQVANSGESLAAQFISQFVANKKYTYPGRVDLPAEDPFGDGDLLAVTVEDENAKFNLNKLILGDTDDIDEKPYNSFVRLLEILELDADLADSVIDWIDENERPRRGDSEEGAKNAFLDSVEELLLIPGVTKDVYDTLKPHVTVFGEGEININSAGIPVLMSLEAYTDGLTISEGMAEDVVTYREESRAFEQKPDLQKVTGFGLIWDKLGINISVKSNAYRVTITGATEDGLRKTITCVLDDKGTVQYWREL
jgi:general secretion pathway protein K